MSVKVSHDTSVKLSDQGQDQYGLPVASTTPRRDYTYSRSNTRGGGRPVCDGVRVPILRDIGQHAHKGATCRFDIVEKVTTVIKAGAYGPSDSGTSALESRASGANMEPTHHFVNISRQPTFHSMVSRSADQDVWAKISPYKWNRWVKTSREEDARDVLYKNTYCMDKDHLRYRTLTLPRLGADRPRTVGDKPKEHFRPTTPDHMENSTGVTIVPQHQRGTVVRFREYMRPYTYTADGTALEVKRANSKPQQQQPAHFATVKSVFPIIRHDSRRCSRKSERPLKFENSRYNRVQKETLFNKQVLPIYKSAFERDYSSADTFKEYLDSLQQCATANPQHMYSRESKKPNTRQDSIDYHSQVLQHVKNVNEPAVDVPDSARNNLETGSKVQDNKSITIEIKSSWKEPEETDTNETPRDNTKETHKTATIDNLSSVHGSEVQARHNAIHIPGPTSSSVVNGETGSNNKEAKVDGAVSDSEIPQGREKSEGGATCPANTPTPMDEGGLE